MTATTMDILMVEDSPADVRLTREAFKKSTSKSVLNVVNDGVEAMEFLRRKGGYANAIRPDLILLDLNLPRMDGREVLAEVKKDEDLKRIPVVIFTTSQADRDIIGCYNLNANCYIVKPADLDQYFNVLLSAESFWSKTVTRAPG